VINADAPSTYAARIEEEPSRRSARLSRVAVDLRQSSAFCADRQRAGAHRRPRQNISKRIIAINGEDSAAGRCVGVSHMANLRLKSSCATFSTASRTAMPPRRSTSGPATRTWTDSIRRCSASCWFTLMENPHLTFGIHLLCLHQNLERMATTTNIAKRLHGERPVAVAQAAEKPDHRQHAHHGQV
jgi:hypothetical protein